MKVLVTGGTGHVGSWAAAALQAAGHDVRLLARTPDKVGRVMAPHGVTFADVVRGDITDAASVDAALDGCDGVLHAAAVVDISRKGAEQVRATNAVGVRNVLGRAVHRGLDPVVHMSSVSALFSPQRPFVTADSAVAPGASAYGRSKAEAEHFARGLQDGGDPVVILYPGGVYGPHDPGLGVTVSGVETTIRTGTPRARHSHWPVLDVRDLADLVVGVMRPGVGPERIVFGGRLVTMRDLNTLLTRITGRKVTTYPLSDRMMRGLGRVNDLVMRVTPLDTVLTHEGMEYLTRYAGSDDADALGRLGHAPRPVEDTLRDTAAWLVGAGHLEPRYAPALATSAP